MIFVLFYSLICPLYHHANKSISTIGYIFMRGVTNMPWTIQRSSRMEALRKKNALGEREDVGEISDMTRSRGERPFKCVIQPENIFGRVLDLGGCIYFGNVQGHPVHVKHETFMHHGQEKGSKKRKLSKK